MIPLDTKLRGGHRQWDHFVKEGIVSKEVFWFCRATVDRRGVVNDVRQNLRAIICNWHQHKFDIADMLNTQITMHEMQPKMAREVRAFIERIQAMEFER